MKRIVLLILVAIFATSALVIARGGHGGGHGGGHRGGGHYGGGRGGYHGGYRGGYRGGYYGRGYGWGGGYWGPGWGWGAPLVGTGVTVANPATVTITDPGAPFYQYQNQNNVSPMADPNGYLAWLHTNYPKDWEFWWKKFQSYSGGPRTKPATSFSIGVGVGGGYGYGGGYGGRYWR